MERAKPPKIFH